MSGPGEDYSDDEIDELYEELSEAFELYEGSHGGAGQVNAGITVTARIEWAGEYANNANNGERTVRLDPMNLTRVRDALRNAQRLEGLAARGPLRSYKARGWEAQLNQLGGTRRGREALQAAGWNPSRETLRRYANGTQAPSKANRQKLADAYDAARNPGRGWVEARKTLADELTATLRATPAASGQNVRFRDITNLRIR